MIFDPERLEPGGPYVPTVIRQPMSGEDRTSFPSSHLPPELLAGSRRRVTIAALVFAGLWAFTLIINLVGPDATGVSGSPLDPRSPAGALTLLRATGFLLSMALAALSVGLRERPVWVLRTALAYQVLLGLILGLLNFWNGTPDLYRPSWICIVILVYPTIISDAPGRIGVAAFATAAIDPAGYWIASLSGVALNATAAQLTWTFSWNFLCATLAFFSAGVVSRLSRAVKKAQMLGSYDLGARIASGGMGEVYRATHAQLASPAAVKLIKPDLLQGSGALDPGQISARFLEEARAVASLRSPHTVRLFDFGVSQDGRLYYAMELLDGADLGSLVDRFGPLAPERAIHILVQACESLAEAHGKGLVHGDIKPGNLFACRMGLAVDVVKVLDFGLARPRTKSPDRAGPVPGTPAFQAPEDRSNARLSDHRSDLYSLGCVGFWLLTGQLVFQGNTVEDVLAKHASSEPPAPSKLSEVPVPDELDEMILSCLSKHPDGRPKDALQMRGHLRSCPVARPWTEERARAWWNRHLPQRPEPAA